MKILHLTDIHSDFQNLKNVIGKADFDLALLSGDITHFGNKYDIQKAVEILKEAKINFYAVSGNCDKSDCEEYLIEEELTLNEKVIDFNNFQIVGLSGSLPCPGTTPNEFTEDDYLIKIQKIESKISHGKPLLFVTHQPPYNTKNDTVLTGFHVGSKIIRNFIEKYSPVICLTGHIHEGKGIDSIGKSSIINPGPLKNGHYALIELIGKNQPIIQLF